MNNLRSSPPCYPNAGVSHSASLSVIVWRWNGSSLKHHSTEHDAHLLAAELSINDRSPRDKRELMVLFDRGELAVHALAVRGNVERQAPRSPLSPGRCRHLALTQGGEKLVPFDLPIQIAGRGGANAGLPDLISIVVGCAAD